MDRDSKGRFVKGHSVSHRLRDKRGRFVSMVDKETVHGEMSMDRHSYVVKKVDEILKKLEGGGDYRQAFTHARCKFFPKRRGVFLTLDKKAAIYCRFCGSKIEGFRALCPFCGEISEWADI